MSGEAASAIGARKDLGVGLVKAIKKQAGIWEHAMLYPIAIEKGDAEHAFGVIVPDLPGCFSAGDSFDEALANAREAIELQLETLLDAGEPLPRPSRIDAFLSEADFKDFIWAFVDVPLEALDDTSERVNVIIPRRVLRAIDQAAQRAGRSRSSFLAEAALLSARELEAKSGS